MQDTDQVPSSHETRTVIYGVEYIVNSYNKTDAKEAAEQILLRLIKSCIAEEFRNTEEAILRSK